MTSRVVFVTGSAGFVGRTLVRALQRHGIIVIGLDCVLEHQSHYFIEHDLRQPIPDHLIEILPRFDCCVHLASSVGGFLHNSNNTGLTSNELLLATNLEHFLANVGCRRIIYTSSINVFESNGSFHSGPLGSLDQRTPYAMGKAQAEAFFSSHFNSFAILRPTNIFGGQQQRHTRRRGVGESHVIPDLLHKIEHASDSVEVLGDGTQERNFIHVSDVVRFILQVLDHPEQGWFNLRSDIQLSIGALAENLLRSSGKKSELTFRPEFMRWEPRKITTFETSSAQALGWTPKVTSLQQGLLF